jgi:phosphoesterase RecJ-like protein
MNFDILYDIISSKNSFLLTTHVNPDVDAIGSVIALYKVLKKLGKKVRAVNYSETPYYLEFLDDEKVIEKYDEEIHSNIFNEVEVIFSLDYNRIDRLVKMSDKFKVSKAIKICIDHHQDPEKVFDIYFCLTEYAATGQILYDFIVKKNIVKLDLEIAIPLYAAIMADSGSFRFERTTPELHRIAAHLLEIGVNPSEVYDKIYDECNFGKIKLLGDAINSIKLYGDKKELAVMIVTQESLKRNEALESDTDGFINLCMTINGVKAALKFMELNDGFKVSLRSKGEIPMHKFAGYYEGGGHKNAAGIRLKNEDMNKQMPLIIAKALEFIKEYE